MYGWNSVNDVIHPAPGKRGLTGRTRSRTEKRSMLFDRSMYIQLSNFLELG